MRRNRIRAFLGYLDDPYLQYFIGLVINLSFLIVLICIPSSYKNIQLPEGTYSNNLFMGSDVLTYVQPARNFLAYGVFGHGLSPDFHRTIGYPLFLALMLRVFGAKYFLLGTLFFQSILGAFIYPTIYGINKVLFPDKHLVRIATFLLCIGSGAFVATVPVILTDFFFTLFFLAGVLFGFLAVKRLSFWHLSLHILFVGYAALIRPVLGLYFVLDCFILALFAAKLHYNSRWKVKLVVLLSTVSLALVCSLSSLRNYLNYGIFQPSDVFENNLFDYLSQDVLQEVGHQTEFDQMETVLNGRQFTELRERLDYERETSLNVIAKYPKETIIVLGRNALPNLGGSFITLIGNYFNLSSQDWRTPGHMELKGSKKILLIRGIEGVLCFAVYLLVILFGISLLKNREFLLFVLLIGFFCYFLLPTFIAGGGARLRLPVETVFLGVASLELYRIISMGSLRGGWKNSF